jgi:tellurite resistance protein TehA-like permease
MTPSKARGDRSSRLGLLVVPLLFAVLVVGLLIAILVRGLGQNAPTALPSLGTLGAIVGPISADRRGLVDVC